VRLTCGQKSKHLRSFYTTRLRPPGYGGQAPPSPSGLRRAGSAFALRATAGRLRLRPPGFHLRAARYGGQVGGQAPPSTSRR
jgi:hypothetical protein